MPIRWPSVLAAALLLWTQASASTVAQQPRPELIVFAASDLGPALQKIAPQFESQSNTKVTLVLGSTGTLSQQIQNGAPADVFFSANESFIDGLAKNGLIKADSRVRYARGRLAVATQKSANHVGDLKDLVRPEIRRISIANPAHAPYGAAAEQALRASGLWSTIQPKLVFGENVQQAVQFVRSGAADAGIVARALVDVPELNWSLVDSSLHAPIDQVAAVIDRSKQPAAARAFLEYVNGAQGRAVLRQAGFLLPGTDF